jgi:hypothetical protein
MRFSYVSLVLVAAIAGCKPQSPKQSVPSSPDQISQSVDASQLPADFMPFYDKFHSDSLFQIAHISWPLQGESTEPIDSTHNKRILKEWDLSKWRMHHTVDYTSGDFKRSFEMMGDALVIERIYYAAANYGLERRFVRNDQGAWELIFYSDMQEL